MIRSMTAFAQAEHIDGELAVAVEIRTVNSRYLDLAVRISNGYSNLEERLKKLVTRRLDRGRVNIKVKVDDTSARALGYDIDLPRAVALKDVFARLKARLRLEGDAPLELFATMGDIIVPVERAKDPEACWQAIEAATGCALEELVAMRAREGEAIASDFTRRLDRIEKWVARIEDGSRHLLQRYQTRLADRIVSLTDGVADLDPSRIAQEAAFLADRSDISEEILRTRSHVDQFREIMAADEAGGRKLNFLLQEINRELNTLGAKAEKAEFAHLVVEMKCEIEKIREQVQNVE